MDSYTPQPFPSLPSSLKLFTMTNQPVHVTQAEWYDAPANLCKRICLCHVTMHSLYKLTPAAFESDLIYPYSYEVSRRMCCDPTLVPPVEKL